MGWIPAFDKALQDFAHAPGAKTAADERLVFSRALLLHVQSTKVFRGEECVAATITKLFAAHGECGSPRVLCNGHRLGAGCYHVASWWQERRPAVTFFFPFPFSFPRLHRLARLVPLLLLSYISGGFLRCSTSNPPTSSHFLSLPLTHTVVLSPAPWTIRTTTDTDDQLGSNFPEFFYGKRLVHSTIFDVIPPPKPTLPAHKVRERAIRSGPPPSSATPPP